MTFSRRDFVKSSVLGAVAAGVGAHSAIPDALAENSQQGHASKEDSPEASGHHLRPQRLRLYGSGLRLPEKRRRHSRGRHPRSEGSRGRSQR